MKLKRRPVRRAPLLVRLEEVVDGLRTLRSILVSSINDEHSIVDTVASAYEQESVIAASLYHELAAPALRENPAPSLEELERAFMIIAKDAVEARHAATRVSRSGRKRPRRVRAARAVADRMERTAREAARGLVEVARARGADVAWIVRTYRLDEWL